MFIYEVEIWSSEDCDWACQTEKKLVIEFCCWNAKIESTKLSKSHVNCFLFCNTLHFVFGAIKTTLFHSLKALILKIQKWYSLLSWIDKHKALFNVMFNWINIFNITPVTWFCIFKVHNSLCEAYQKKKIISPSHFLAFDVLWGPNMMKCH